MLVALEVLFSETFLEFPLKMETSFTEFQFSSSWATVPASALELLPALCHNLAREEQRQFTILLLLNSCLNKLLALHEAVFLSLYG